MSNIGAAKAAAEQRPVKLEVFNPLARIDVQRIQPAARVPDLNNKRVLLYWNGKVNSDVAVAHVKELFEKRFKGQQYNIFKGIIGWIPLPEELVNAILDWKPDVIVAAGAD